MAHTRKTRCDRWDAALDQTQVWRAYDVFRRSLWVEFLAWAERELPGVRLPGRNALYDWARDLRSKEATHRLRQAAEAKAEVGALAEIASLDVTLAAAYKSMAATAALNGDRDTAVDMTKMALGLAAQHTKSKELELKASAQATRDEALNLAREKFMFNAVKASIKHADTIKSIVADNTLVEDEKILAIRRTLFGDEVPQ